jgi:signal transduction histidine kinase
VGPVNAYRTLIYLESLLLAVTATIEVVLYFLNPYRSASWLVIGIAAVFAGVGWWFRRYDRTAPLLPKVVATLLEALIIMGMDNPGGPQRFNFISVLCIVATIRACWRFRVLGRAIVASSSIGLFVMLIRVPPVAPGNELFALSFRVYSVFYFALILTAITLLVSALLAEQQSREELAAANQQLRSYALRIENQATLQERSRIAREIHDSLGHTLMAQAIALENIRVFFDRSPDRAKAFLQEAIALGGRGLQDVRQSITALRQHPVQRQGLLAAVQELVAELQQAMPLEIDLTCDLPPSLPPQLSQTIYRLVQEGLTNIQKHSSAQKVQIEMGQEAQWIRLAIVDDGRGCDPQAPVAGFGWQGMRERVQEWGGTIEIQAAPNRGCTIWVALPKPGAK